jgi:hypothetical protein
LLASEQDRPGIKAVRGERAATRQPHRLVFLDETGTAAFAVVAQPELVLQRIL